MALPGRNLHRERHVRFGSSHTEFAEQGNQVGIGSFVEHQKTGVYAVGHRAVRTRQGDVHCVRVSAKVITRLKQSDVGFARQRVGHCKA